MYTSCGPYEHINSPWNAFWICVIALYFLTFLFFDPVQYQQNRKAQYAKVAFYCFPDTLETCCLKILQACSHMKSTSGSAWKWRSCQFWSPPELPLLQIFPETWMFSLVRATLLYNPPLISPLIISFSNTILYHFFFDIFHILQHRPTM